MNLILVTFLLLLHIANSDERPTKIVAPEYPRIAYAAMVTGTIYVNANIDIDGNVTITSIAGPSSLQPSARESISQWHFAKGAGERKIEITIVYKHAGTPVPLTHYACPKILIVLPNYIEVVMPPPQGDIYPSTRKKR